MKYPKYYWNILPSIEQEIEALLEEQKRYKKAAENSAFLDIKIAVSYFRKQEAETARKIEELRYRLSILCL